MPELVTIAPVTKIIRDILLSDPELYTIPYKGGVIDRVPQSGKGDYATPQAFYGAENPSETGRLKPTISVISQGDVPSPNGVAVNGLDGFALVQAYVPVGVISGDANLTGITGDEMLAKLERKLRFHFDGVKQYPLGDGSGVRVRTLELLGVYDADELGYAGRKRAHWRVRGTYVRP